MRDVVMYLPGVTPPDLYLFWMTDIWSFLNGRATGEWIPYEIFYPILMLVLSL
ncbi:hypothetical protein D3C81_1702650 [compost metagenome]